MSFPVLQSPFKVLDSYEQKDRDIFFGRKDEIIDLNHALSGVKQLLLYGPSGSGKTSLIECGLRNQFSDADWFALTIRRGNNLNQSFFRDINKELQEKIELDDEGLPKDERMNFGQAIQELFSERYRPVYLLFDQFEELLILGNDDEKKEFFDRLNQLIRFKVPCRIILIMREEFIGYLSEYENRCPSLFQHRFRLEKMGKTNVREVITGILTASRYRKDFKVRNVDELCEAILERMPRQEIELAHVQVFLNELWNRACKKSKDGEMPLLHPGLIEKNDKLDEVLNNFLKDKIDNQEVKLKYGENVPLEVLVAMLTERDTKLQIGETALKNDLDKKGVKLIAPLSELLVYLQTARIIRDIKVDDDVKYEISHDILARLVGQNRTQDMKLRQDAERIYSVIQLRDKASFLSVDDLKLLLPYEKFHTPEIKKWIVASEANIEAVHQQELTRATKRLRVVRGLLVAALLALAFAVYYSFKADQEETKAKEATKIADFAKEQATNRLLDFQREQAAKDSIQFNELNARANTILEVKGRPLEILNNMKVIYEIYCDTIPSMRWIKPRIESIQYISDSLGRGSKSKQKR